MDSTRTGQQNRALHKYFQQLADALNDAGLDFRLTLKDGVDVPWSKEMVKDYMFKPIMKAMLHKESTTELDTKEVNSVYEVLNRHTAQKLGVSVEFPREKE